MVSRYPYIDRNSCIIPAGKDFGDPCQKAKECFYDVMLQEKVDVLRKHLCMIEPKDYGPERKQMEYPGVFTKIGECLTGPLKTQFECIEEEVKNSVYDSFWNKALGKTRDPTPGLPRGLDIYCSTFGKPSRKKKSQKYTQLVYKEEEGDCDPVTGRENKDVAATGANKDGAPTKEGESGNDRTINAKAGENEEGEGPKSGGDLNSGESDNEKNSSDNNKAENETGKGEENTEKKKILKGRKHADSDNESDGEGGKTTAYDIILPRKTAGQVIYEDRKCHDLYRFSHQDYYPGERINRNYAPPYNPSYVYGNPSYTDHSGAKAKRTMLWFNNDPISNVSRRQAAVRERTSAPIGQSLDKYLELLKKFFDQNPRVESDFSLFPTFRTGVSSMFDHNHTFGKPCKRNYYAVEDLLNQYTPSLLKRDMKEFISYANKLRRKVHQIINRGDIMLEEIYEEFQNLDKEKVCSLHFDCIDTVCKKNYIYFDRSKLEPLLLLLDILKEDGTINYRDFLNFIDLNKDFPPLKREHFIMPPEYQEYDKQHRSELPPIECKCKTYLCDPAGVPNNPLYKPGPHFLDSKVNIDHLGAETTARALVSPSIYTQYGLSHRDLFKPRTKEFLADLFKRIGCTLSDQDVDEIYREGVEMDKSGGVCVETFKNILDLRAYNTYKRIL